MARNPPQQGRGPAHGGPGPDRGPIYPPRDVRDALNKAALVHPTYRFATFCPIVLDQGGTPDASKDAMRDLCQAVNASPRVQIAAHWRGRRASWLEPLVQQGLARRIEVVTITPCVLWLSFPGPTELGFCLHKVYGLPYLPSSALKGLSRAAMWREKDPSAEEPPDEVLDLFGDGGDKGHIGCVEFLDGIPVSREALLELDVMTPHHAAYYAGQIGVPHDCEGPNPLKFPVIPAGRVFEVALVYTRGGSGAQAELDKAERYLVKGLEEMGLGAKTTSGYGRFRRRNRGAASTPATGPSDSATSESSTPVKPVTPPPPTAPSGPIEVTLKSVDQKAKVAVATTQDGREIRFPAWKLSHDANIYRPDWNKHVGKTFLADLQNGEVVAIRRKEGA